MPTARPRHMITETDELAAMLDSAALLWPELANNRSKLLRRLLEEGSGIVLQRKPNNKAVRLAKLRAAQAAMAEGPSIWPANWREEELAAWPD